MIETEINIWYGMLRRCFTKGKMADGYGNRGITVCQRWRCLEGLSNFVADMGRRPSKDYSIDRIDNDGHYSCGKCDECRTKGWPANCRWADRTTQSRNRRCARRFTHNGQTKCLSEWCEDLGLDYSTVLYRLKTGQSFEQAIDSKSQAPRVMVDTDDGPRNLKDASREQGLHYKRMSARMKKGMSFDDASTKPAKPSKRMVTAFGETASLKEMCEKHGIDVNTVIYRLKEGWTPEEALTAPLYASHGDYVEAFGQKKRLTDWCREHGLNVETVRERLERGWAAEEALTAPAGKNGQIRRVEAFGETWTMLGLATAMKVSRFSLTQRINRGATPEEAVRAIRAEQARREAKEQS